MLTKLINKNIELVTKKPKLIIAIVLGITILSGILASFLRLELSWVALAPKGDQSVKEYQQIIEDFPSLSSIMVVVEGDDRYQLEEAARTVEDELIGLNDYVSTVTVGIDQKFALEYGLLYLPPEEIEMMGYALTDPNIDTFYTILAMTIDETIKYISNEEVSSEELQYYIANFDAMLRFFEATQNGLTGELDETMLKEAMTKFYTGNSLLTSADGKMALITVQPSFDVMNIELLVPGVNAIEERIKSIDAKYDNVSIRATGMHFVARDEMESVESDSYVTTLLSIIIILAILYFAFRTYLAPVLTFIPLVLGIIWSVGLTQLFIGRLNMMTAFSAAMLLGLGIDYSIHFYSSYTAKRASGLEKHEAIKEAISISGTGIITGALTTAVAFLALNISSLELLKELGTVMGIGIITTLISVFWVLPALIVLAKEKAKKVDKIKGRYQWIGHIANRVYKVKKIVVIVLLIFTIFMGYKAKDIRFDTNLMNIEPKGLASIELMTYLVEKYDMSSDSFSIEVESIEEVYRLHEEYEKVEGVATVSSIADILPKQAGQEEKLEAIAKVKEMLNDSPPVRTAELLSIDASLEVIKDNLSQYSKIWEAENYDGLTETDFTAMIKTVEDLKRTINEVNISITNVETLSSSFYDIYKDIRHEILTENLLTIDKLPDNYKKQFISKNGDKYMLSIYPDFDIWENLDSEKGKTFFKEIKEIDPTITGTPIFMRVLYESVADEILVTGILVFVILFIILFIHFRRIKYTLLAFLPLLFTLIYTLGMMVIIDMPFNILNVLSILLIIGIGIDDGVHILHHYKAGEQNIFNLFSSVGRAILLTTLTTMCGFGSLAFSSYVGISSLGIVLFIGVAFAFIMTIVVLPLFLKDREEVTQAGKSTD